MVNPTIINIVDGLFGLIVVVAFLFFVVARVKKISVGDLFNEVIDSWFGKSDELALPGRVDGIIKKVKLRAPIK